MSQLSEQVLSPSRVASAVLIAVGVVGLSAVTWPADTLGRLVTVIDPARTPRQLLPVGAAFRSTLAGLALVTLASSVAIRMLGPRIHERLLGQAGSPAAGVAREPMRCARWEMWALGALSLIGIGLRSYHLALPIEADEAMTYVLFASRTLIDIVSDYTTPNNHVLHSMLVGMTTGVYGPHLIALRAPAFLAGVAAIPLIFWLGRRERSATFALALAALVAVGPPFVEYSGRARGYTIQFLLLLWCLFAARNVVRGGRPRDWIQLGLASALGMWTSPSFMLPLGGIALWLPFQRRESGFTARLGATLGIAALATLLLYSPIILRSGWDSLSSPSAWDAMSLTVLPAAVARQAQLVGRCWGGGLGPLAWPGLLVLVAGLALGLRRGDRWARLIAFCLLWLVALTVFRGLRPRARMFNWLLPLWFMASALTVSGASRALPAGVRRWAAPVIVGLAGIWGAAQLGGHASSRATFGAGRDSENYCAGGYVADAEPIAEAFAAVRREGDLLVVPSFAGAAPPLRFHLMQRGLSPAALLALSPDRPPSRAAGFSRWYVVAPKRRFDLSSQLPALEEIGRTDDLARVATILGVDIEEMRHLVRDTGVFAEFETAVLFRLDLRPEIVASTPRLPDRDIVQFAW